MAMSRTRSTHGGYSRGVRVKSARLSEQFGGVNATSASGLIEIRTDGERFPRELTERSNGTERGIMSSETLDAIHAAVQAHFDDQGETGHVAAWVVAVELQDVSADMLEPTVTYRNDYTCSESSPNTLASIAAWTSAAINETAFDDFFEAQ